MKKESILIVNSFNSKEHKGGAEIISEILCNQIKKENEKVYFLTTTIKKNQTIDFLNKKKFINIIFYPWFPGPYKKSNSKIYKIVWHFCQILSPFPAIQLLGLILRIKPRVTIVSNIYGLSLPLVILIKIISKKTFLWIHDFNWICIHSSTFNLVKGKNCDSICLKCKILRLPYRFVFIKTFKIFISNLSIETYKKFLKLKSIKGILVNNPCQDFDTLSALGIKRINNNKVVFGYIGSITYLKGIEEIIKNFLLAKKYLETKKIKVELNIAGEGDNIYLEYLCKKYEISSKEIKFLGYKKPVNFYQDIDVVIINSLLRDTFPGVGLETLIAHRYLLVTDLAGTNDLINLFPDQLRTFKDFEELQKNIINISLELNNKKYFPTYDDQKCEEKFNPKSWYKSIENILQKS